MARGLLLSGSMHNISGVRIVSGSRGLGLAPIGVQAGGGDTVVVLVYGSGAEGDGGGSSNNEWSSCRGHPAPLKALPTWGKGEEGTRRTLGRHHLIDQSHQANWLLSVVSVRVVVVLMPWEATWSTRHASFW